MVQSLGHYIEVAFLEKEANNSTLHGALLRVSLFVEVALNMVRCVARIDQVLFHCLRISHRFISFHDNSALGVDRLSNLLQISALFPLEEEVASSVGRHMHQHSSHFIQRVLLFVTSDPELVHSECKSSFDEPVQGQLNSSGTVSAVFTVALFLADRELLPLLEAGASVEVHAPLSHQLKQLHALFLVLIDCLPCLEHPTHLLVSIIFNHLSLPLSEIQRQPSPHEPLLSRSLGSQVLHVVLKHLRLDTQGLQDHSHLLERGVSIAKTASTDATIGSFMFCLNQSIHLSFCVIDSGRVRLLSFFKLLNDLGETVLSPSGESFLDVTLLDQLEEPVAGLDGNGIDVALACDLTNSLEDFLAQGFSSDSANHVDGILFSLDIISPSAQDVSSFVNVSVLQSTADKGTHGGVKVLFKGVPHVFHVTKLILQFVLLGLISLLLILHISNQGSSIGFLGMQGSTESILSIFEVSLHPLPERTRRVSLHPVNQYLSDEPASAVELPRGFEPGVETSCRVHIRQSGDVICDNFAAKALHLCDRVLLSVLIAQDGALHLRDGHLVVILSLVKLFNV